MSPRPRSYLEHEGRRLTLNDWMRETGINADVIRSRLRRGWPVADALSVPQLSQTEAAKRSNKKRGQGSS